MSTRLVATAVACTVSSPDTVTHPPLRPSMESTRAAARCRDEAYQNNKCILATNDETYIQVGGKCDTTNKAQFSFMLGGNDLWSPGAKVKVHVVPLPTQELSTTVDLPCLSATHLSLCLTYLSVCLRVWLSSRSAARTSSSLTGWRPGWTRVRSCLIRRPSQRMTSSRWAWQPSRRQIASCRGLPPPAALLLPPRWAG